MNPEGQAFLHNYKSMANILIIEDHETLGFALQAYLEMKGFAVLWSKDGDSGLQAFEKHPVDLCIVDVGLPGRDGFSLAREIRRQSPGQPLIFLTARALKADRLKGFDLGADDYLVKPVDEEELVARIRAILRRAKPEAPKPETLSIGQYTFDPQNQELAFPGQPTRRLTEREAHLLLLLCQQKGQLLSRAAGTQRSLVSKRLLHPPQHGRFHFPFTQVPVGGPRHRDPECVRERFCAGSRGEKYGLGRG